MFAYLTGFYKTGLGEFAMRSRISGQMLVTEHQLLHSCRELLDTGIIPMRTLVGSDPRERALADLTQRPFAAAVLNCQHLDGQMGAIWHPGNTGSLSQIPKPHHLSASSCAPKSACRASWREQVCLVRAGSLESLC